MEVLNYGDVVAKSIGGAWAAGIDAQATNQATVYNTGSIQATAGLGAAYGIYANGNSVRVVNSGSIKANGYYYATGISGTSVDGEVEIYNYIGGVINAKGDYATGISGYSFGGDVHIDNSGVIDASSNYGDAIGIDGFSLTGYVSVDNSGSITASSGGGVALGVSARADYGTATVINSGDITASNFTGSDTGDSAYGVAAIGDYADVVNSGSITAYGSYAAAGIAAFSYDGTTVSNTVGSIYATAQYGDAIGIYGYSQMGDVSIANSGTIEVISGGDVAVGVFAQADYGTASVTNSGDISASTSTGIYAYGVYAHGAYVEVANSGNITAEGYYYATGIAASSYYGTTVTNTGGSITAYALGGAAGIDATSLQGDVDVANASDIEAVGLYFGAQGISAYSFDGDVQIDNSGDIYAASLSGDAIGIYGYSLTGDVSIYNAGDIVAYSYAGLADGIFASGANVDVTNYGAIESYGYTWSAGIEAQGADTTTVDNTGSIYASAALGVAYGIYATGNDVMVDNSATIEAQGYYATGIEAESSGDVSINNNGDIVAGSISTYYNPYTYNTYVYGSALATGINAESNGESAAVGVTNSGDISAVAYYGGTGISATSSGQYGTASVTNSGSIYASQYNKYGYGAYGIVTSADGDSSIDNSGDISVVSGGVATGLQALSFAGEASVTNSGDISTYSSAGLYYASTGISAFAANGDAHVDNSGSVDASAKYWASAVNASAQGDVTVDNSGSLYADGDKYAFGVYALSNAGDVSVHNDATGEIGFYSYSGRGWGVFAYASQGDTHVTNDGAISGYAYGQSVGVFAVAGSGDVTVDNSGSIDVVSGGDVAVGAFARADYGTARVSNSGDITASNFGGYYTGYSVYGVLARGAYVEVANSGNITAEGYYYATGIAASSYYDTTVTNTGGSITAYALGGAAGIDATSLYGDVNVDNASDIEAVGVYFGAQGISGYSFGGDVEIDNSGDIYAASPHDNAIGIYGYAPRGDVLVDNSGSIEVISGGGVAMGVFARADDGTASVYNSGDITASNFGGDYTGDAAYGVVALGAYVDVVNSGNITAEGSYDATGIAASSYYGTTVSSTGGNISATASVLATGISARAVLGHVNVDNASDINVASLYDAAIGIAGYSPTGDVSIDNSGDIYAASTYDDAIGISARSVLGDVNVDNASDIYAESQYGDASGIAGYSLSGDVSIDNAGDIVAYSYSGLAVGIYASGANVDVTNSGDIHVAVEATSDDNDPGSAVGIGVVSPYGGDLTIQNSGDVSVHGYSYAGGLYAKSSADGNVSITNSGDVQVTTESATALGVYAYSYHGDITVNNAAAGHIDASGGNASVGIQSNAVFGDNVINNAGSVHASGSTYVYGVAMKSYAGTSTLNNAATGTISVNGTEGYAFAVTGSDVVDTINNSGDIFGAVALYGGDDVFNNLSGGLWDVGDTRHTEFGDGNDAINNMAGGVIHFADGAIFMGAGDDSILNLGTIVVAGDKNVIDLGGDAQDVLTNSNTISFLDGHTDDALKIAGNLGGTGSIGIDVDLANLSSDQLHVEGNMLANAAQHVNVALAGVPLTPSMSIDFAHISGTSAAGSFVPGQVLGYNHAGNFLDLGLTIGSRLNAANTADDVFFIALNVVGLNDTGTLAANVASGAAAMLNAQVGTFKQRMGVNPYGDDGKVLSAFFRTYTSEGDVNPLARTANFGLGGNFAFDQTTWGREVGVNANLWGNLHAGITLGTADSRQRLTGNGVGSNRMDGMTWGWYATWFAPQGFYVDLSGRWMAVDVRSTSAAGQLETRAHTGAWNLEAGYQWTLGGLSVVPQLQYTRTEVEDVRTIYGDLVNFEGHGGTSSRGRVGVEISKTFEAGDMRWTPYGSISAIREFDGEMSYTVADSFFGRTDTEGTSAMVELGLGVQKNGWGFTIGANWIDGGAFESTVSGQAVVRFAW